MLQRRFWRACCLRAVNAIKSAFWELACHLSPCMFLKLRFVVDSIPSALTKSFIYSQADPSALNLKLSIETGQSWEAS
jgi:hypothetical protein